MPSTTRIFSEQQSCCCVTSSGRSTVASVFASPLRLHCRALCIDDMLRNLWCAIRLYKGLRQDIQVLHCRHRATYCRCTLCPDRCLWASASTRIAHLLVRRIRLRIASSSSSTTMSYASSSLIHLLRQLRQLRAASAPSIMLFCAL